MSNENYDHLIEKPKDQRGLITKNPICKDGFCYLPNSNEIETSKTGEINIFDPL